MYRLAQSSDLQSNQQQNDRQQSNQQQDDQQQFGKTETETETETQISDYKLFIESAIEDAKSVGWFRRIIDFIVSVFNPSGETAKKRQLRNELLILDAASMSTEKENEIANKCKEFNFGETSKITTKTIEVGYDEENGQADYNYYRNKEQNNTLSNNISISG